MQCMPGLTSLNLASAAIESIWACASRDIVLNNTATAIQAGARCVGGWRELGQQHTTVHPVSTALTVNVCEAVLSREPLRTLTVLLATPIHLTCTLVEAVVVSTWQDCTLSMLYVRVTPITTCQVTSTHSDACHTAPQCRRDDRHIYQKCSHRDHCCRDCHMGCTPLELWSNCVTCKVEGTLTTAHMETHSPLYICPVAVPGNRASHSGKEVQEK